jgi:hypothetical protein
MMSLPRRRFLLAVAVLPLAACTETASEFSAASAPRASARGATVALILDNAPEALRARLAAALADQAVPREINLVQGAATPRFRVRAHVSAAAGTGGNELAWAFDVFDSAAQRTARISGEAALRGSGDALSAVTDGDLQAMSARALDELAAIVAAAGAPPVAGARPQRSGRVAAASQPSRL